MAAVYPPLAERPLADTICLFDVDNTLSLPRKVHYHRPPLPSLRKPPRLAGERPALANIN